ncbi:TetR/AcrR family transcriptional regulator [Actinokineospora pegani]|uniref:TetR/AcrR family transcriptional regulator n=1 Tax=Actinokineospora pegani TaxID=2654637 RepID=UPI0018D2C02B|nr:TetR/AcrR family transcriptional regulator [Actinokineospora pegani]
MSDEPGLRDRKKAATRAALSHAAWSIMVEDGLAAVSPESVAERVGVSSRTFRNYFASREEAIIDGWSRRHHALADRVRERPPAEPLWDSLVRVLPEAALEIIGSRDDIALMIRVITESPTLLAHNLLALQRTSGLLAEVVAERTGERRLVPHVVAGAVLAALASAVTYWATHDTDEPLPDLLRQCLEHLRAGLPVGPPTP